MFRSVGPSCGLFRIVVFTMSSFIAALLSGCLSSHFVSDTTPTTYFQTGTQIVDGNHNPVPGASFPRPYQPLRGTWVSDMTNLPTGTSNWGTLESFGSAISSGTPGELTYDPNFVTDKNGSLKVKNLRVNANWNYYYNWLPLPYGCVPQGDASGYQVPSAGPGEFISSDPHDSNPNPVAISATWNVANNDINQSSPANAFLCYIEDRFLTTDALTTNGSSQVLVSTICSSDPCSSTANPSQSPWGVGPLQTAPAGFGAPVLQADVYQSVGGIALGTLQGTPDSTSNGYRGDFAVTGLSLPQGIYGTYMYWYDASGIAPFPYYIGGEALLNVSSANASYARPFGVGAASFTEMYEACPTGARNHSSCTMYHTNRAFPVVADISANTLTVSSSVLQVWTRPVAVVTYGEWSDSTNTTGGGMTVSEDASGTSQALVVNSGSNNVSIVDLIAKYVIATVATGTTPVAAVVDSAGAYAYVADYGDSCVTKVDLKAYEAVATFPVIASPTSIALDGSGNVWVGGNGVVASYNSTTYAPLSTRTVTGVVSALGISAAQNKVLVAAVGPATGGITGDAMQISKSALPSSTTVTPMFQGAGTTYSSSSVASMLPTPYLLGDGMVVSAQYKNNYVISATPTGYVVQDVANGAALFNGTTSAPVRGVAVEQTYGCAYLSVPDAHEVITVWMPGGHLCD